MKKILKLLISSAMIALTFLVPQKILCMDPPPIEQGLKHLTSTPSSISSIEHMFSKLVFSSNGEEPVEFHSHECVRIAHCLIEGMKVQKKEVIKPLEGTSPKIPSYSSYNDQVESEFQKLTSDLLSKAGAIKSET